MFENFVTADWKIYFSICIISVVLVFVLIKRKVSIIFLSIAFISAGAFYFSVENSSVSANRLKNLYDSNRINSGDPLEIEGVLQSEPESAVSGIFILIRA